MLLAGSSPGRGLKYAVREWDDLNLASPARSSTGCCKQGTFSVCAGQVKYQLDDNAQRIGRNLIFGVAAPVLRMLKEHLDEYKEASACSLVT